MKYWTTNGAEKFAPVTVLLHVDDGVEDDVAAGPRASNSSRTILLNKSISSSLSSFFSSTGSSATARTGSSSGAGSSTKAETSSGSAATSGVSTSSTTSVLPVFLYLKAWTTAKIQANKARIKASPAAPTIANAMIFADI